MFFFSTFQFSFYIPIGVLAIPLGFYCDRFGNIHVYQHIKAHKMATITLCKMLYQVSLPLSFQPRSTTRKCNNKVFLANVIVYGHLYFPNQTNLFCKKKGILLFVEHNADIFLSVDTIQTYSFLWMQYRNFPFCGYKTEVFLSVGRF